MVKVCSVKIDQFLEMKSLMKLKFQEFLNNTKYLSQYLSITTTWISASFKLLFDVILKLVSYYFEVVLVFQC